MNGPLSRWGGDLGLSLWSLQLIQTSFHLVIWKMRLPLRLCREIWPAFESRHLGVHFTWSWKHRLPLTYILLRENSAEVLLGNWLTTLVEDRESALISRRYGVHGSFILVIYWNWCSSRLEMGVSWPLWIFVKDVKSLVYDVERGMAMEPVQGKCASSWVDLL